MSNIETQATRTRWCSLFTIRQELLIQGREYGATFLTEAAVALSLLLTYRLAAHDFGKDGFSEYAIARRTISLIFPLLLLGLPVALPRFIAYTNGDARRSARYYGATLCCLGFSGLCALLINLFRKEFAYLFFGASTFAHLGFPISLVLAGLTLHAVVYAYFRGHREIKYANLLHFTNFAIVPLVVFSYFHTSVHSVLTAWGIFTSVVAVIALLLTPWRNAVASRGWDESKELLCYGVQRIPGDFALLLLMSLPAIIAVHLRGMQEGGSIAFGTSLLNMMASMFSPVGVILLPKASHMFAEQAHGALREHVTKLVLFSTLVAIGLTIGIEVFARPMIRFHLGNDFTNVAFVLRIVALGALPYSLYYVLSTLIDAYHTRAVNGLNCIFSLALFLVACVPALFYEPMVVIPWAFVLGLVLLGVLTVREARRIFREPTLIAAAKAESCECQPLIITNSDESSVRELWDRNSKATRPDSIFHR